MKILFIGDIYGKPGIKILTDHIKSLQSNYKPNIIIANAENASYGRGITKAIYKELMSLGIACLTMGNWVWGNKEIFDFIEDSKMIRPINFVNAPGSGALELQYNDKKILIINALGRTFMNGNLENPFTTVKEALASSDADYKLVDFHAEATSEKVALGHYLDGLCDAIIGTHTHIPTADERKLPNGTLYITDVGMTGPKDGVIGVKKEIVIDRFIQGFATPNEMAPGDSQLNAVILDLNLKTIQRIHIESKSI
ncbi:MAG: TIGR00282 family metallophosphoesterase [Acholeplasmataceae bacterium]